MNRRAAAMLKAALPVAVASAARPFESGRTGLLSAS